jgi:hypothetical protein
MSWRILFSLSLAAVVCSACQFELGPESMEGWITDWGSPSYPLEYRYRIRGEVRRDSQVLIGVEAVVELLDADTIPVHPCGRTPSLGWPVDEEDGTIFGRLCTSDGAVCGYDHLIRVRYRVGADSTWRYSPPHALLDPVPDPCAEAEVSSQLQNLSLVVGG